MPAAAMISLPCPEFDFSKMDRQFIDFPLAAIK
jgi:hypothetical protein